ncbi:MAG: hypothetical protein IPP40_07230 [bacterium]|nr:hypothetical protein [bacterium]
MKTIDNLAVADQKAVEAAALQIFESLKADGSEYIHVDPGFNFVWYKNNSLYDISDRAPFKRFLVSMGYLKPEMKHKFRIIERLNFWIAYYARRFKTTDCRIDGLAVRQFNPTNGSRRTKKAFDWVLRVLTRNLYILKDDENV